MSNGNRGERNQAVGTAFSLAFAFLLVSLIVGVLAYSQGKEWERRYDRPAAYAESGKQAAQSACAVSDPAAMFECVHEKVESSQEQARAEQDLDAQQGMKFWAAVMAILAGGTAVITAVGVWYVKRTLETNVGFLKESRDATKAMVKANKIASGAQRPWLKIAVEVTKLEQHDHSFFLQCDVTVTNIGRMAAFDCAVRGCITNQEHNPTGKRKIRAARDEARKASRKEAGEWLRPYPLLPNESATFSMNSETLGDLVTEKLDDGNEATFYIVFVAARYRVQGEKRLRKTDRAFCVSYGKTKGERSDPFGKFGIPVPFPIDLSLKKVTLRRAGHTRTT